MQAGGRVGGQHLAITVTMANASISLPVSSPTGHAVPWTTTQLAFTGEENKRKGRQGKRRRRKKMRLLSPTTSCPSLPGDRRKFKSVCTMHALFLFIINLFWGRQIMICLSVESWICR